MDQVPGTVSSTGGIVGCWNLVTFIDTLEGVGSMREFGQNPLGQFIYTADGQLSVQIMHDPNDHTPLPEYDYFGSLIVPYMAYFGTYTVGDGVLMHNIIAANQTENIGTDTPRPFKLDGYTLIIGGIAQVPAGTLIWNRVLKRQ